MVRMVNPSTNTEKNHPAPWLWTLLWAPLYFAYKGIWLHAIINLIIYTFGGSIIYAFFAGKIIRSHFQKKGFREGKATPPRLPQP
ncbi:MAG: hypothetical protein MPK06_03325 [Alphaproteobacteria bacterium]|nr:hypothetical protein [Alphaproteobacteria bacterium]MDA7984228.1 hypothetical protein [Alphaproteobacteria bacterium]MDA7989231.1 hypothetical protein [Alphaproteobacteria bacterium]MDA8001861.1 hypothetical protein [Alphaproteobacteria bacterium]MDA8004730.1 hypothetical protein [Alphaproteobacteria bacterium]